MLISPVDMRAALSHLRLAAMNSQSCILADRIELSFEGTLAAAPLSSLVAGVVAEHGAASRCNILLDAHTCALPDSLMAQHMLGLAFAKVLPWGWRMAVVLRRVADMRLWEDTTVNRGKVLRLFDELPPAIRWLERHETELPTSSLWV